MEVIMHYPKTENGLKELQKRAAVLHAEIVEQYLLKLPCSKKQKLELLDSAIKELKEELKEKEREESLKERFGTQ